MNPARGVRQQEHVIYTIHYKRFAAVKAAMLDWLPWPRTHFLPVLRMLELNWN